MYIININDDENQIITIPTESVNYSVRKQENIIIISIHTFIPVNISKSYVDKLTPKLSTKLHVVILKDNNLLLSISNITLDNFTIGIYSDIKDEFSLQFKDEAKECLG